MTNRAARAAPDIDTLRADQRARRDRIVDAAVRLMIEVDYERIQVKDVADAAEVALGTLYRYFPSKDMLFAHALISWSEGFRERMGASSTGPTLARVTSAYRRAVRAFERQPRVYDVMIQVQASGDPSAVAAFRAFASQQSAAFAAALSRLPASRRDDVMDVLNAVLDVNLRSWRLGYQPIADVYTRVERAAALLLGH